MILKKLKTLKKFQEILFLSQILLVYYNSKHNNVESFYILIVLIFIIKYLLVAISFLLLIANILSY